MATTGYVSALGGLAKDAVIGAGKGFVGGLKGAMMSEAPGLTGAYAFAKELRNRANAPKMSSGGSAPSPPAANKPSSSSPMAGGLGVTNDKSIVAVLRQGNIINLEQVSQLKQLNANVINQSKLLKFTVDDTKRKDQFAEEVAKEQALRDDRLLQAIRNIGSGGGGGKRGGGDAANDSSSGGFLSSLLGGAAGGAMSKLVPLLSAAMAALPWAKILKLAGPASLALSLRGDTPDAATAKRHADFETARQKKLAEERAAEEAKVEPRPAMSGYAQRKWDEKYKGKKDPETGKLITAPPPPPSPAVTVPPAATAPVPEGFYSMPGSGKVSSLQGMRDLKDGKGPKQHNGVDYAMPPDSWITPIRSGIVDSFDSDGTKSSLGRHVIIDHEDGIKSTYAHLSAVNVSKKGQGVNVNSILGLSGGAKDDKGAGHSQGPHLHLEVKRGSTFLNIADLSGLEASGQMGRSVDRGKYNAAKITAAPPVANSPASTAVPAAGAVDPNNTQRRRVGTAAEPFGDYYARLFPNRKKRPGPKPLEADLDYFKNERKELKQEAELNKLNAQKITLQQNLKEVEGGKFADPESKAKSIQKYKDDIAEIDKKISQKREGVKSVAPISTDSEIDAKKKKIVEEFKEKMKTIIEDIKNIFLKIGDSNSGVDLPKFANMNMLTDFPFAETTAMAGAFLPDREVTSRRVSYGADGKITGGFIPNLPSYNDEDRLRHEDIKKVSEQRGFSEEYLRQAADPTRHGRFWITVEEAKKQLADLEEKRKRVFLTTEKSSYGNNTAGLGPSYVDNGLIDDMEKEFRARNVSPDFSGTKMKPDVVQVEDKKLAKQIAKANVGTGKAAAAVAKQTFVAASGKQLPTKLDPFKPNFRGNTEILAEANKQFLKELRSTFTGLARKGLKDALLPDGVGVSFKQATQDNLFRGQQLKIINDTTKKINAAAVDLLGKKYGPMFAPMLDKLSTSYFEVGSRLAGRQLFTRFGGLDDKETMGITGQVLGNIAAGKKQLAFEQILFGMSGGRKSGIALNAESLFAKYGFEDSQQGISYFADVLGEKATQPFSKLMGADDRSKSIIRDPRTGKLVYADSGKEATKDDIKAGYGGRISKEPLLGPENEYLEVPGYKGSVAGTGGPRDDYTIYDENGKIIGRKAGGMTKSSVTGGSISAPASKAIVGGGTIKQILNADSKDISRNTVFGTTEAERIAGGDALRAKENTYVAAQVELLNRSIEQERELAKAGAKREYDAALKVAKSEEEANEETYKYEKTLTEIQNANADVNAKAVINKLDEGQKGSAGDGTAPAGLKVSGRRPGQLFDANVYEDGKITGKDPMKEIGNFGFDILKLGVGSEMTKGISNPYIQTIANFAIQKGMNAGIEAIMGTGGDGGIFSKIGSMFSSSSSSSSSYGGYGGGDSYGGVSDIFSMFFKDGGLVSFPNGGPVSGPGTGTSDSIPAYVSNGEFVVNAKAAARNYALLNAINQSTLPKKNTSGSGTYEDSGGPGSQGILGGELGLGSAQDRSFMRDIGIAINEMNPIAKSIAGALIPGFSIASFFSSRMAQRDLDASNVIGGQSQIMSQNKGKFRGDEIREQNETEAQTAKDYGKTSWGKTGNVDQDIGQVSYADVISGITAAVDAAVAVTGADNSASNSSPTGGEKGGENLAKGGLITGKGSGTSDSIFSMLSNGEFVINAKATKANLALLNQINSSTSSGSVPKSEYERNLSIEPFKNTFKGFADGGLVTASTMNAVPRPTSRSPYILSPPTNNSSSENQNNSSNMIIGPKTSTRIDNSSVTNFYNQASGMIDSIRSVTPQVA